MSTSKEILNYVRSGPVGLRKVVIPVAIAATGTEHDSTLKVPEDFYPLFVEVSMSAGVTNAVTLNDIGPTGDPDGFMDNAALMCTAARMQAGFACTIPCNGAKSLASNIPSTTLYAPGAGSEVRVTVSGDTGTAVTCTLTFWGCG